MAFDYGQKRVGIAVTDPDKIIATSLPTVLSHEVFNFLRTYTQKEKVELFVVGLAKQMNNSDSESMNFIRPFIEGLKNKFPDIPVEMYDERFTSKLAFQAMIDGGLSKKDRQNKATVDSVSATILLQDFMEFYKQREK